VTDFEGQKILITGGTGSFGRAMVDSILQSKESFEVIVFSRDELKQFEMRNQLADTRVRFLLGDVRDRERLMQASRGVTTIIHAAAMKQIPAAEDNPMEAIKTNVVGAENVINVAIANRVSRVIALSTDKAANPSNLYGATKLCSDKLFVAGNSLCAKEESRFSVVRYGNVLGSRGSVIPFFVQERSRGLIPITDVRMTRFWLSLDQGVRFVRASLEKMQGGEIFVPKIPSFKVVDVAHVVAPGVPHEIVGIRPGEKLHETMITPDDSLTTYEFDDHYEIIPDKFLTNQSRGGQKVVEGFSYTSENNPLWFSPEQFRETLILNGIPF